MKHYCDVVWRNDDETPRRPDGRDSLSGLALCEPARHNSAWEQGQLMPVLENSPSCGEILPTSRDSISGIEAPR